MHIKPFSRTDELENLVRKCIVFPADSSETCIVPMIAQTVTVDDIASLKSYNRCVDMSSVFCGLNSDDYRKSQVIGYRSALRNSDGAPQSAYLFFYNLSSNLLVNLNVASIVGITGAYLTFKRHLFWRGDVVALKVQPSPSEKLKFIVESLDADLGELGMLRELFWKNFQEGALERVLGDDELQCE